MVKSQQNRIELVTRPPVSVQPDRLLKIDPWSIFPQIRAGATGAPFRVDVEQQSQSGDATCALFLKRRHHRHRLPGKRVSDPQQTTYRQVRTLSKFSQAYSCAQVT